MKNLPIFRYLFLITGAFLFLTGIIFMICANMNIGVVFSTLLGALLLFAGVNYWRFINSERGIIRFIRYLFVIGFCAWVLFSAFLLIYGKVSTVTYNEDILMVLGCSVNGDTPSRTLVMRLDKAREYLDENTEAMAVVTGGKGPQENISEADAMATYLINCGIEPERIIKENTSTSTFENFKNSKKILDSRFGTDYSCAVITSDFHIFRAKRIAKECGMNVSVMGAPTEWYMAPVNYIRETLAIAKNFVFGG